MKLIKKKKVWDEASLNFHSHIILSVWFHQINFFHQRLAPRMWFPLEHATRCSSSVPLSVECEPNLNKNRARPLSDSHKCPSGEMTAFQKMSSARAGRPADRSCLPANGQIPRKALRSDGCLTDERVHGAPIWPLPLPASILKVCKSRLMSFPASSPTR